MADTKDCGYPEMQRGITAFILMNVQAKKEARIVEKLFELAEVREIHSVHGDVDLLVKVQLTRGFAQLRCGDDFPIRSRRGSPTGGGGKDEDVDTGIF